MKRPRILWTAILLAVVTLILLKKGEEPREPARAGRLKLEQRDGLYFLPGTTNRFTGLMVDFFEAGAKKSETAVSNGWVHGLSQGWHTNGQLQIREQFRLGVSSGLRTRWHENGRKESEATVVDGKLHGMFRRWHDNGQLSQEVTLVEGQPHGLSRAFDLSGALIATARMNHGHLVEQHFRQKY